ncbi:GspS/AspS pilotin family protein [Vibrio sp. SS-MA-C1-2]|uniref:type II secretion system pilot lipoprotein GspS-beta n=1 Tax=Vibrio sp. SS-MA-C1-2 TaxID=2908646 RepID=UPI001F1D2BD3|nr:type II secretion system pilot lipoprotein GspS-beta [Vibrio sp. SS-MA-C1-2]UJF19930.1 GspS/AspS pilotin family protein [Vibrio sp. SS-MA-C1-2]
MKLSYIITFFMAFFLLSGCANKNSEAEALASHRASVLKNLPMPMDLGPFKLLDVKSKETMVELIMLDTGNDHNGIYATESALNYCRDPELRSLLTKGVTYRIIIKDNRGRTIVERNIAEADCQKLQQDKML